MDSVKPQLSPEQKELQRFKRDFVLDYRAQSEWRRDKKEYGRFYDGDQLSSEEKRELEARGQPAVVINRIKPKIDSLQGIELALPVNTKAFPAGDKENEAQQISEELRTVEKQSEFDEHESEAFLDMLIDGVGYYECIKKYQGLRALNLVEHLDNDVVVLDRHGTRPDLKDSKRIHKTVWQEIEDVKGLFPGHDEEIDEAVEDPASIAKALGEELTQYRPDQYQEPGGSHDPGSDLSMFQDFVDDTKRRVRVVTTYFRTPFVRRFLTHSGGTTELTGMPESDLKKVREAYPDANEWTDAGYRLNVRTFIWNAVLERKDDIRTYDPDAKFPIVMALAYRTRDEKKKFYGLVKQHLDPQREVNKRRSKSMHLLNTQQVLYEKGAWEDDAHARQEIARPDCFLAYRKEFKVDIQKNTELAQSQFQLLQEAKQEIDSSGVNKEIEGQGAASSGREFQLRQQQAMQSIRKLFQNLRAARKRVAAYLLDEILQERPDLAASVQTYDIVVEEAPDSINLMGETFETLSQLALKGFPIPPDILMKLAPVDPKIKGEILQRLGAVAPGGQPGGLAPTGAGAQILAA